MSDRQIARELKRLNDNIEKLIAEMQKPKAPAYVVHQWQTPFPQQPSISPSPVTSPWNPTWGTWSGSGGTQGYSRQLEPAAYS